MLRFLHLPLRLRPGIAFPFKPGRNKGSLSPPALNQALVTTTRPYISVMSHTTCCRMTPLPHVLGAQWAVGGLSARQKGSAAERGREPGILMIFFFAGCITMSVGVPSVHRGHAICRGPRRLPSLPGISGKKTL